MFEDDIRIFATATTVKCAAQAGRNSADHLKAAVAELVKAVGRELGLLIETVTEGKLAAAGRPDIGVSVKQLLTGYIGLKAPGKGADPTKLKMKNDRQQWEKFKQLPNLIYTDGNEWSLYRNGEAVGKIVRLTGDVRTESAAAIGAGDAAALLGIFRKFLGWQPIVPKTPKALAKLLAPLCRLLRSDVAQAIHDPESALAILAQNWRDYLFPAADDDQFTDAYAQTMTYALLLARLSGDPIDSLYHASMTLQNGHRLLGDTLKILGDDQALAYIKTPIELLERTIAAVDTTIFNAGVDPWLYFYEDFLEAYDPKLRKQRGVYYTPVQVVEAQVRLVSELLVTRFNARDSFVDPAVTTLDPALGTGTYLLRALQHALDLVVDAKGPGKRSSAATIAAQNMHAFEMLVGPYAVGHLRLSQQLLAAGATLPSGGVQVYLADTLESPYASPPASLPLFLKRLTDEHKRAQAVKLDTQVMVCIGNPPYHRESHDPAHQAAVERKGGWVRFGDRQPDERTLLQDFIDPAEQAGQGRHLKNLYNDYVYFWRWALWKVFEQRKSAGIVSFITASSYLTGPAFGGMRKVMREIFDELWLIDLEGDTLGARKTDNVFAIQTPVAIAVGVRYGSPQSTLPAGVHYTRIEGTAKAKLDQLAAMAAFSDLAWTPAASGWMDAFLPTSSSAYTQWPLLTDIFPWQENGMQFKRTWPIAETPELLQQRWQALLAASDQSKALKQSESRTIHTSADALDGAGRLPPIGKLPLGTPALTPMRYAYRSFDRQWMLPDPRLCDRPRLDLFQAHSAQQVYLTSLLTNVLGAGPAAVVTGLIPDLDHFRGSFGAKHIIPLWRDAAASVPNISAGVVAKLSDAYGCEVSASAVFAYCYALLAAPGYVRHFWEELRTPGPRIPLPTNGALFQAAADHGRRLVWLHTYGERWAATPADQGRVPGGAAKCQLGTADYPESYGYDPLSQELRVGTGLFAPVAPDVWAWSVSGFKVVESWLGYRMLKRKGKTSSPLDALRPAHWTFDDELLELLWVLEATITLQPKLDALLQTILDSPVLTAQDFPPPSAAERRAVKRSETQQIPLAE